MDHARPSVCIGAGAALLTIVLSACGATPSAPDDADVDTAAQVSALEQGPGEAPGITRDPGFDGEPAPPPNGPAVITVEIPPHVVDPAVIAIATVQIPPDPPLNPVAVPVPDPDGQLGGPGEGPPPLTAVAVPIPTTPAPGSDLGPAGSNDPPPGSGPVEIQPGTGVDIGVTSIDGGSPP